MSTGTPSGDRRRSHGLDAELSRRRFASLFGVGALAVGGLLSACGSDDDTTGAGSDASSGATAASVFPVTVTHKFGTTTVPSAPKRVVSVGVTEQDTLLALGVIPVGVTEWYGDYPYATWPWAQAALGDAKPTVLKDADGLPFEKIASLAPDLIIGTNAGLKQEDYDKLTALAPTIAQSGKYTDYFEPWNVQSLAIGTAVGKEKEVTALIADIQGKFATAAAANPSFAGKKVIFLQNAVYDGSLIAYQKGLSTEFLTSLGFEVPDGLEKFAKEGQAYIPLEQISVLNAADILIWATEKDEDRVALEKAPGFMNLTAVKNNRSIYTGGELSGAIYFTSPLSLPYVIDKLVPQIAAVL
jgi:iron complex transport system substrate-binding protein